LFIGILAGGTVLAMAADGSALWEQPCASRHGKDSKARPSWVRKPAWRIIATRRCRPAGVTRGRSSPPREGSLKMARPRWSCSLKRGATTKSRRPSPTCGRW